MNRRNRHLVVLAIAVVTATIASFGVYRAVERIPGRNVDLVRQFVVVAARPMPLGSQLTERDVKVVAWPAANPVVGAYGKVGDVVNRALLTSVLENEPLVPAKLTGRDGAGGLPTAIPRGMRAISVKVNDVIGVAGFVEPGCRVDLMVTMRQREDSVTRTVARNVQVMTAGTRQDQQKPVLETKAAAPSNVVTLMVTPDDAERIALAQSEGQIMLILRNPLDSDQTMTGGVRTAALLGQSEPVTPPHRKRRSRVAVVAPPPPEETAAKPKPRTVEAIRAAKRTEEVIR